MKKLIKQPALFVCMVVLFVFVHQVAFSQVQQFTGKNITQLYYNVQRQADPISKYLKKYDVYSLDINGLASYVKGHSPKAQFVLTLASQQFNLELELNDMRGVNFKAVAMTDTGPKELAQTFANTYKGFADNNRSNIVRLNIDASTFEGYINIGKKWLYIDKLNRYLPHESTDKIIIYDGADVIPNPTLKCGAEILNAKKKEIAPRITHPNAALTGNCHFVEIATEADYDYYQAYGSDANTALQRIRDIFNLVEGLYTPFFNVKFIIRYQQIWTTADDPYSFETGYVLDQFRDWWNAHMTSISRDVTHMFTGQPHNGGTAFLNAVCNTSFYYGFVANYSPVSNVTITLSAHELGHNFGADHDTTCNGHNIMCPVITDETPEWSSQSITQITDYINNSGSCMTESFPTDIVVDGDGTGVDYLKLIAANTITLNASASVVLSPTGFGYMEAGTSIVLTPTSPVSLGFLAPEGSVLLMRISDVINSCDPLNITSITSVKSQGEDTKTLTEDGNFQIRPNPFNSTFELIVTLKEAKKAQLRIYNSLGVKVKENQALNLAKGLNTISVNGANLSKGVYLVELYIGNIKTVRKIVRM